MAVNKKHLQAGFSKYATEYDNKARVQKVIADKLIQAITHIQDESVVYDLGCGTGYCIRQLREKCNAPDSVHWVGVDISEGMLVEAKSMCQVRNISFHQADIEKLQFESSLATLMVSSLALQWVDDLSQAFKSIRQKMHASGICHIATLVEGTLPELTNAWAQIDNEQHVLNFRPVSEIIEALSTQGLELLTMQEETVSDMYVDLSSALKSIKEIGAGNHDSAQSGGLTSVSKFRKMLSFYEQYARREAGFCNTYKVLYFSVKK